VKGLPTVLVIEDNSTIRKLFRITLAAEGYAVLEAGDGRAAIELFGRCQPALVVQDLLLPDIDGLELVRRLRTLPRGDEVPILACSGMLSKLDEARLLSGGFNDFLLKPVELSRLVQAVQAHVPIESPSQTEKRGRRVLVVDDEPVRRKQVATRLAPITGSRDGVRSGKAAQRPRSEAKPSGAPDGRLLAARPPAQGRTSFVAPFFRAA